MQAKSEMFFSSKIFLTKIQRFSLHDGPGIRTTVFLKTCSLRCPWCSNPENLNNRIESYVKNGVKGCYGEFYDYEKLYKEVIKDKQFYKGELIDYDITNPSLLDRLPGGITFSGGEALLQIEQLKNLLKKLHKEHIHMAVETCLFVPEKNLRLALHYIDLFYVDIKILDVHMCKEKLCGDLNVFLHNLEIVMKSRKPVVVRIPVIADYTYSEENRRAILELILFYTKSDANILKVELIREHNLGISKYKTLSDAGNEGFDIPQYREVTDEMLEIYKKEIEETGIWTEICKI